MQPVHDRAEVMKYLDAEEEGGVVRGGRMEGPLGCWVCEGEVGWAS